MERSMNVTVGTKCGLPARSADKKVWIDGKVVFRKGPVIKIKSDDRSISKLSLDNIKGARTKKKDVKECSIELTIRNDSVDDDMINLHYFHLPGKLQNIKARSLDDKPYTFLSGMLWLQ